MLQFLVLGGGVGLILRGEDYDATQAMREVMKERRRIAGLSLRGTFRV